MPSPAPPSTPDRVSVGSEEIVFRVTSRETDGALLALEVRMPPGGGPPALHRHDPSEVYRVERGELALYVEDDAGAVRRTIAGPGAVVHILGGREHTNRNESEEEAQAYVVFAPGAGMEGFARAAGALATGGPPRMEEILAVAECHGVEMTRPLGALDAALAGAARP
jgi:mannose-6-phosphate isomerase-like protein (cupin superfamily)